MITRYSLKSSLFTFLFFLFSAQIPSIVQFQPSIFHHSNQTNSGNHTPLFTHAAQTLEAHIAAMKVTKGLALTGLRVLSDEVFFEEVKTAFEVGKEARMLAKPDNGMYKGKRP